MKQIHCVTKIEDLPAVLDELAPGDTIETQDILLFEPVREGLKQHGRFLEYFDYLDGLRQANGELSIEDYRLAGAQAIHLVVYATRKGTPEEQERAFLQAEHDMDPDNWDHHPDRQAHHPRHPQSTHPHRWRGGRYQGG